ncbi:MAG TPA: MmgE/PrpD family protein [Methylomirabilota bacterium]|jgi:2-methylcitrate dehydratase PrpD|nr:MmgE/PrpD family protein [Methylomirabilota bacterium]
MSPPAVSQQLADRIAAFRYSDLPSDLVAQAKLYLLDTLGAMLVASAPKYPASRIIMRFVSELGGVAESSLVGQGRKTSCVNAALANATLGYYCDIEPHHVGGILHGPAVIVPTSLAVGERQRATGQRVLASMILGIEVATRVSYAFDPVALYNRGFHPSAVCGAFGAAAAAGHLLRLDARRQAVALGLAMQQACGLLAWASDPTEHSRPFNPGLAARNGTTAACLAHLGFGGPPAPFEGKYDAFTAFSGSASPDALLADWGKRFHLPDFAYKLYSSCSFTHPGLDALLGLAADEKLTARDVERIVLRFPKNGAHMIDGHPLKSHCAQYILPVGLVFGRVMIDDILFDRQRHPEVARLSAGMTLVHDPALDAGYPERYTSIVELALRDGRMLSRRVEFAKGTRDNPLAPTEVVAKYFRLTRAVIPRARAEAIRALVDRLDQARDVARLATLLRQKTGRSRRESAR